MQDFFDYIEQMLTSYQQEEANLLQDDRKDEANLVKIRINIYDIAKTIYQVFEKQGTLPQISLLMPIVFSLH